jgi:hypothetical protein
LPNNDEVDLMDVAAIDIYKYGLKCLSILFTDSELKKGAVEPTAANKYKPLDQAKINLLKSAIRRKYDIKMASDFDRVWRELKRRLNDKCRDKRNKPRKRCMNGSGNDNDNNQFSI